MAGEGRVVVFTSRFRVKASSRRGQTMRHWTWHWPYISHLSTKNVTGFSRSIDGDGITRRIDVPVIDEHILHLMFTQARQQFPDFSDWYTNKNCKTMKSLNDICKKARLEIEKQAQRVYNDAVNQQVNADAAAQ